MRVASRHGPPATPTPCPECGGDRIICQTWEEGVLIPGKSVCKDCVPWMAHVCTVCSYVTHDVTDPQGLVVPPTKEEVRPHARPG
jgi:hypothetical protein